jgi:flagellin
VLSADNATDAADLAAKLKGDSDYNFIRDQVGLGSSKLELFEVIDVPAGKANVSGNSIDQLAAQAATNDIYTDSTGKLYLKKTGSGTFNYVGNVRGPTVAPITQTRDDALVGEIYKDGSDYKVKTSGANAAADGSAITVPTSGDQTLLTNALQSSRVQKLKINYGEDATDRAYLYQSRHNVTITDIESSITALDFVDQAAKVVNESRARMGATMSRIEYTINNLMNLVENTEEAKSRVLDTDYAKESAELAKAQILAQAGTAMLAQANQSQQYVLNLLRQG